jgi:homoserine dehydrogenase
MSSLEVLKFGSSVLRTSGDIHVAVDEIYRRWRCSFRVIAIVSAFEGVTDILMSEVTDALGSDCPQATADYVSTGELKTAALLLGALHQCGLPARLLHPRDIGLTAEGSPLESAPVSVDHLWVGKALDETPILVLPGFYGVDREGNTSLFGRGGSDLTALFLATELKASCRLLKDVIGVFDADPARSPDARRFSSLSWGKAVSVSGPLIQPKALLYAKARELSFDVGRPNTSYGTTIGQTCDKWARPQERNSPIGVALVGCGVVGRGVYESIKRYPDAYTLRHVVVRDIYRYLDIEKATTDPSVILNDAVEVVIVCIPGLLLAYPVIAAALSADKYVITSNKAAVAANGKALRLHTKGTNRRLWYSAAVGGALPALETVARLQPAVREIRGIINGTCGFVLAARAQGKSQSEAIALAQAEGFAEANPYRDLSGRDSADKLALLIESAFGHWIDPEQIPTLGIDTLQGDPGTYKLVARAARLPGGITATVTPEIPLAGSFLSEAKGPENRIEIELEEGEVIRLRGQGAGRWPTTVSVIGDLHEIARRIERSEHMLTTEEPA